MHRETNSNRTISFSFVGGEPTQWAGLLPLCRHIRSTFSISSVMSNGAASLAYWNKLSEHLDRLVLTHHEGKIDFDHFAGVADLFKGRVSILFAMVPETFDASYDKAERLRGEGIPVTLQPIYRDHTSRRDILPYTDEQRALLFPTTEAPDIVIETTRTREYQSTDEVIYRQKNSFFGWKCGIGTDQLCVSPDGAIRGGWCRVGGILGNIHEGDFTPPEEPLTCTRAMCTNPADLAVPKWRE